MLSVAHWVICLAVVGATLFGVPSVTMPGAAAKYPPPQSYQLIAQKGGLKVFIPSGGRIWGRCPQYALPLARGDVPTARFAVLAAVPALVRRVHFTGAHHKLDARAASSLWLPCVRSPSAGGPRSCQRIRFPNSTGTRLHDSGQPLDRAGVQKAGIRYGTSSKAPLITQDQAIAAAKAALGNPLTGAATRIDAHYVLFSNDQYFSTDAAGIKHYVFLDIPAWIVTFEGVTVPWNGSRGSKPGHNSEMNVAVDAQTGESLDAYSYR